MTIRALLHVHSNDDPYDVIPHTPEMIFHEAQKQGINAIAFTCHNRFTPKETYQELAKQYGILFISGIEKTVEHRDVVILNADTLVETIQTFDDLRAYRRTHPNCFVIAAHPYFPGNYSLHNKLEEHIDCFDAIELSWFYTKYINFNKRAEKLAKDTTLPFIATPDAHRIEQLCTGYIEATVFECSELGLFDAIRKQTFINIHKPKSIFTLAWYLMKLYITPGGRHQNKRSNTR